MSKEKAIEILGLPKKFTEEELKAAYRRLCKENHPDINGTATEEKQKDINCAYDVLKTYLKEKTEKEPSWQSYQKSGNTTFDLEKYRTEKSTELEQKISFPNYETIVESEKIRDIIFNLEQYQTIFIVSFSKGRTKEEIDKIYEDNMRKILEEFKRIALAFCKKYDIPQEIIKEKLNPNCNLDHFYKQLTIIKGKYSKLDQLKERLAKELLKYKSLEYYEKISQSIEKIKNIVITNIRNSNYQNIDLEITKMHQYLMENIIKEYEIIENKIKNIESDIPNIKDTNIHALFKEIKENWEKNSDIEEIKNALNKLDKKIEEYQKQDEFLRTVEPIYTSLINKYTKTIQEKNLIANYQEIKEINELFEKHLELFKKGCEERKNEEFFVLFNQIQFKNDEQDKKILKQIQQKIRRIYVKKKDAFNQEMIDSRSFFWVDDPDEEYSELLIYRVNPKNVTEYMISKQEFEEDYIPLDELLTSKSIVGMYKKDRDRDKIIFVLAENEKFILYKINEDYVIGMGLYINLDDNYGEENLDKEEIINLITTYIRKRIENLKNNKQRK